MITILLLVISVLQQSQGYYLKIGYFYLIYA